MSYYFYGKWALGAIIPGYIRFTNLGKAEITDNRTAQSFSYNTVGSQLSGKQIWIDCYETLEDVYDTKIPELPFVPKRCEDGEFYHFVGISVPS